jgi:surface polysaccharide O-acyltransferase-like enzyme
MFKRTESLLADTPVNYGRQLDVDIAKAQMVLMLPFIHCIIECTTDEGLCSGIPYLFDTIIGGPFSAPMYLFAMGIGFVYSRRQTAALLVKRGITLIGIFYLSNTCRFLIPYLIGYGISGDREHFIVPLFYRWLGNDVLLFAGLTMLMMALFTHFGLSDRAMIAISAVLTLTAFLIGDVDTHSMFGNIFLGYLVGTDDATGLVVSDFPLLTWLIIPVCGYAFGHLLIRVKDKTAFYRTVSPLPFIIAAVYFPVGIHFGWGMFGEGQNCYYHMNPWDIFICLCLDVGMLGLWHNLSRLRSERVKDFLSEVSANITAIYCIHWVFVRSITNVIIYIINGTQILPLWQTMLLALAIDIASVVLAHYYKQWKTAYRQAKISGSETKAS